MRRRREGSAAVTALLCALVSFLAGGASSAGAAGETADVAAQSFQSHALASRVHYMVYLPAGYSTSGRRYPVVYVLHGLPASPIAYQGSQWISAAVRATGRDAIVVVPQAASAAQSDPEYYDWGPGKNWQTALAVELPADVDAHFRTIRNRTGRSVVGFSAGGYGAIMLALRHPATFSSVESWSGYFRATDPTGETSLDLDGASAHDLVPRLPAQLARYPTFIGFYVGKSDPTFVPDNLRFDKELTKAKVSHVFAVYPGSHTPSLWETHAKVWLSMALGHLSGPVAQ